MNDNLNHDNNQQQQILNSLNNLSQNNNQPINFGPTNQFINQPEMTNNPSEITGEQNNNTPFSLGTKTNTSYIDTLEKETDLVLSKDNTFINEEDNYNETSLNNLNIDGTYNQMLKKDYSKELKVMQNMENAKKNTIPISKELKTFLLIALVLFVFIIIMPYIFDLVRKIKY